MTHPLDIPNFLDRRGFPTPATDPEAAGGAVKAAAASIAEAFSPDCNSGPAAPAAGPTFPRKDHDPMAKTLKADGSTSTPKTKNGKRQAKLAQVGSIKPETVQDFANRLHNVLDELEETSGAYRKDCQEIYEEIREAGISVKSFKLAFSAERQERKRQAKLKKMEGDERQAFEDIRDALGTFSETELGQAAIAKAETGHAPEPTHPGGTA